MDLLFDVPQGSQGNSTGGERRSTHAFLSWGVEDFKRGWGKMQIENELAER